MTDRSGIERVLNNLYAKRVRGDLDEVCRLFSGVSYFQIGGGSHLSPISIRTVGIDGIRGWLRVIMKTFAIADFAVLSKLIDAPQAAIHWHANIQSRITRTIVATEFVDIVRIRDDQIVSYVEFISPR